MLDSALRRLLDTPLCTVGWHLADTLRPLCICLSCAWGTGNTAGFHPGLQILQQQKARLKKVALQDEDKAHKDADVRADQMWAYKDTEARAAQLDLVTRELERGRNAVLIEGLCSIESPTPQVRAAPHRGETAEPKGRGRTLAAFCPELKALPGSGVDAAGEEAFLLLQPSPEGLLLAAVAVRSVTIFDVQSGGAVTAQPLGFDTDVVAVAIAPIVHAVPKRGGSSGAGAPRVIAVAAIASKQPNGLMQRWNGHKVDERMRMAREVHFYEFCAGDSKPTRIVDTHRLKELTRLDFAASPNQSSGARIQPATQTCLPLPATLDNVDPRGLGLNLQVSDDGLCFSPDGRRLLAGATVFPGPSGGGMKMPDSVEAGRTPFLAGWAVPASAPAGAGLYTVWGKHVRFWKIGLPADMAPGDRVELHGLPETEAISATDRGNVEKDHARAQEKLKKQLKQVLAEIEKMQRWLLAFETEKRKSDQSGAGQKDSKSEKSEQKILDILIAEEFFCEPGAAAPRVLRAPRGVHKQSTNHC